MRLARLATACDSGSCPTIYATEDGDWVLQGRAVDPASLGLDVAPGEALVAIPASVVRDAVVCLATHGGPQAAHPSG